MSVTMGEIPDMLRLIEEILSLFSSKFDKDVTSVWNYEQSVEQYQSTGGTSLSNVEKQIKFLLDWLRLQ